MNGWQRRPIPEPPQGQEIPPALLERIVAEHLKALDQRQDEIAARIRARSATSEE
jgi:hypothetical protein